ncbi:GerAB/ArcD/ProY family transporter [Paenibacillus tritici]|uniref:GerAB/ArcD/ProY family transporter n=1 Tax=Paenibacillus tritici TaxID=1873425 RepID=A0ABX2DP83_9BACL|nr:GerAB/ArcD/ProY family transporter [Paenibacillus tritici]NQX45246.1 GerAB/ArcD/ProY family transporter [Paenibacillus tritici]
MAEKLTPFHITILVYMTQSGIIIFTLPRQLAEYFGTNGWLFMVPCFVISSLNIYLISLVYHMGKGRSIFLILEQSISKVVLYPLYIGLSSVWLIFGCMIGKKYVLLFQMISFPTTNPMIFKLAIDLLALLLLTKGIYTISKATTVFFWVTIWMYLLLLGFIPNFQWVRLTPFIFKEGHDMVRGGLDIYTAFLGYELSLLYLPYMDHKKKSMRGVYAGNTILSVAYISFAFICFGFFSLGQLKKLLYPLLDLLAFIQLPFVERLENLLYGFFLFLILVTVVMYWWAAAESVQRILPRANISILCSILVGISFVVSYIPTTLDQVNTWIMYLSYAATGIAFGLPLLLVVLLLVQRKRRNSYA